MDLRQVSVELVAEGLAFPEGPAFDRQGRLLVTEIAGQRLTEVRPDGSLHPVVATGGGPNGMAVAPDGTIYVCNNGGRWPRVASTAGCVVPPEGAGHIQAVGADGVAVVVLDQIDGRALASPNDCCCDLDGGLWFTDPVWQDSARSRPVGSVCYLGPDGVARRAHEGLLFPNGIALAEDGRYLFVAESMTGMLWSFPVEGPGRLGEPRPSGMIGRRSVPDGFCLDTAGHLVVCGHNGDTLYVLASGDGRPVAQLTLPEPGATNCCFGGPELRTLYLTSSDHGRLFRLEWPVPGAALPAQR